MLKKLLAAAAAVTLSVSVAQAEDFYKDKTITLVINLSAGGSTGRTATLFSRHWSKHIPGNPNFIVQPVTGGALKKGIVHAQNARPDGLTIGWVAWGAAGRQIGKKSQQVDWTKFDMIAGAGVPAMAYARKDIPPGLKTPLDIVKTTGVKIGGYTVTGYLDLQARMSLDLLGVKYNYTTGYRGGAKIVAALQRNEINFHAVPSANYFAGIDDNIVGEGIGIPLWYYALSDGKGHMTADASFGDIMPFHEIYKEIKGKYPSGEIWDAMVWLNDNAAGVTWMIAAPKGTPADRLAILRKSFMETNDDPAYRKEMAKISGAVPPAIGSAGMAETVKSLSQVSPKIVKILQGYIKSGTK